MGHEQDEAAGLQSARLPDVSPEQTMEMRVGALVEVADFVSRRLYGLLKEAVALQGSAADAVQETFFSDTEPEL